ncbi:type II toxin-antitoxin system RelE/ParE family toxin [Candidatus Dojkabacteria bacterium]|nr:type II toxin-antitoxin system RelE/ParE family toxin [Candidatus Dojkabacteria bacterium]
MRHTCHNSISYYLFEEKVYIDNKAERELRRFNTELRAEFKALIDKLAKEGHLKIPFAKKIDKELFEMRVRIEGAWRGFYSYIQKDTVIILHFFRKKSQKTPRKKINTARKRLRYYK